MADYQRRFGSEWVVQWWRDHTHAYPRGAHVVRERTRVLTDAEKTAIKVRLRAAVAHAAKHKLGEIWRQSG